jgi:hypothetical protein
MTYKICCVFCGEMIGLELYEIFDHIRCTPEAARLAKKKKALQGEINAMKYGLISGPRLGRLMRGETVELALEDRPAVSLRWHPRRP